MAEVTREIVYRKKDGDWEPVLSIKPKTPRDGHHSNFAIRLDDLWMYTPDKNPNFEKWMYEVVMYIYKMFNLGIISSQRMAEVATVIEDGIDGLLKAPPEPPAGSMELAMKKAMEEKAMLEKKVIMEGISSGGRHG